MVWLTMLAASGARAGATYDGSPQGILTLDDEAVSAFVDAKNAEADAWLGGDARPGEAWAARLPVWPEGTAPSGGSWQAPDVSRLDSVVGTLPTLPARLGRVVWLDGATPAGFVLRGPRPGPWLDHRRVRGAADLEAGWVGIDTDGGALLLVTDDDLRAQILRLDPSRPRVDEAFTVLATDPQDRMLDARILGDTLLVARRFDGLLVLERVSIPTGERERLPVQATAWLGFGPRRGDTWVVWASGIEGEREWVVGTDGDVVATIPGHPVAVRTVYSPSGVPITLVEPEGGAPADAPLLVHVYGGFGLDNPVEDTVRDQRWLRGGGRVAAVHARGGGERGPAWHEAGRGASKHQTVADTVGAVAALHAMGYGVPQRTALWGESNGGLIAAAAAAARPELFGAVVAGVGPYDLVHARGLQTFDAQRAQPDGSILPLEDDPTAWWNGGEYPSSDADARALSPVYATPAQLPPILLFTGRTDRVVNPVHSVRLAAAWDEVPGGPVLLQVHPTSTHGPPPGSCWFGWAWSVAPIAEDALSFVVRALDLGPPPDAPPSG